MRQQKQNRSRPSQNFMVPDRKVQITSHSASFYITTQKRHLCQGPAPPLLISRRKEFNFSSGFKLCPLEYLTRGFQGWWSLELWGPAPAKTTLHLSIFGTDVTPQNLYFGEPFEAKNTLHSTERQGSYCILSYIAFRGLCQLKKNQWN